MAKSKVTYNGNISKGIVTPNDYKSVRLMLSELGDCEVEVSVRAIGKLRSNPINRYYWGVVVDSIVNFLNASGQMDAVVDRDWVHDMLKKKFLGEERFMMPNSEVITKLKDSKSLTNAEFCDYLEQIWAWCASVFDLYIPEPNEEVSKVLTE